MRQRQSRWQHRRVRQYASQRWLSLARPRSVGIHVLRQLSGDEQTRSNIALMAQFDPEADLKAERPWSWRRVSR